MNEMRAIRELVRQVADEPIPPIDWDRVERGVFDQLDHVPVPLPVRSPRRWQQVFAIAAVAAAVVAVATQVPFKALHGPIASGSVPTLRLDSSANVPGQFAGVIESASLHPGDRLVADAGPVAVHHPGHASWVVADHSNVVVEQLSPVIVLNLESGSMRVEVEPQPKIETFVVRVGETAVSVHGTIFSVARKDDRAVVRVERGSVSVGSRSRFGQSTGWLVVGPGGGSFSLDGARSATFFASEAVADESDVKQDARPILAVRDNIVFPLTGAAPTTVEASRSPLGFASSTARPLVAGPPASVSPQPAVDPTQAETVPETLSPSASRPVLDAIAAQISICRQRQLSTPDTDMVRVTVQSTVQITVAPDGHVERAKFDPPLAPSLQACAGNVVLGARFPKAMTATQLQLPVRL